MSTIKFDLSKKLSKTLKQILVRISYSREFRVAGKTRIFISPKDWDEEEHFVRKTGKTESLEKQREVDRIRKKLHNLEDHIRSKITETKDLEKKTKAERQNWMDYVIESFYDPTVQLANKKNITFSEFAEVYVQVRSRDERWRPAVKGHANQKKFWDNPAFDKLSAVQTQLKKMNPNLLMDDITGKTIDEYQKFLVEQGFLNSTIRNHKMYLKQILKWANDKGYLKHGKEVLEYKALKLVESKPRAINYLTWDEFKKMYNYHFEDYEKHLELTRDRFCFACATSLRHSDLEILKKADFDDIDNPTSFSFVSKKTHDNLTIYLNKYSKELYQKYKDVPTKDGLLFPPKSNQKMNDNLKVIAERLGFTREVSKIQFCGTDRKNKTQRLCDVIGTHTARRTFVVHTLDKGWSPQVVMSYTGHDKFETLKPYIDITNKTRKNLMDNFFE